MAKLSEVAPRQLQPIEEGPLLSRGDEAVGWRKLTVGSSVA